MSDSNPAGKVERRKRDRRTTATDRRGDNRVADSEARRKQADRRKAG